MWRKIINFLFDSVYQVVTWVWIGVSISAFFFFASNKSGRGMVGSAISLFAAIIIMLSLMAKKHFWDGISEKKRPELYTNGAMMGPLSPGEPETVLVGFKNRGNAPARNICLGGGNHVFTEADFAGPLVYKHVPVQVRPDLGPGPEEQSVISKSPQPLSQKRIEQLENGEVLFFHFAEGEYNDDEGNSYPIDYCYMFNPLSPTVMRVCPEKYWPKSRTDRRGTPTLDAIPNATAEIKPPAPIKRPKFVGTPSSKNMSRFGSADGGARSHSTPYDRIKWTDYTEDYFDGAIWRWGYRPEMGDKEPRNIRGICPDCGAVLSKEMHSRKRDSDGFLKADFICHRHNPIKWFQFKTASNDPLEPIRVLIRRKLETGDWEDAVKRQIDVGDGRV